ncbi:MAG: MBL fold metallo-hydrolase [Leptospiraceae bacterium]|nr:MBL fold metallo-hydrolase [Leptospiraceae bacterium]MCB1314948.1 MBL fold metallo-hydrolase [Leptospiraceae bacterium]
MKVHHYSDIPPAQEIGENLFKIEIPQPFYADNNVYIIRDEEPALIDSGYVQNLGMLQRSLAHIGLSLKKIRHIFYTHEHIDHISAALVMRYYARRARLYGMTGMAESVGDYINFIHIYQRAMDRLIYKAHADRAVRQKELDRGRAGWARFLNSVNQEVKIDPRLRMDVELVEGDVVTIGRREIGFIHTPGHNRWHLTPYILGEGVYFTGDLVLQNISSIYAEIDGNLADYHNSLNRLMQLPIKRLLPAHGPEPEDPRKAVKLISKTLSLLQRGLMRRLKENDFDLSELVIQAIGEKVRDSSHYVTALATIHAMLLQLIAEGHVEVIEVDPPYEKYRWRNGVNDG